MAVVPPVTSLFSWCRLRPRTSLTPGAGFPGAVHCCHEHAGQLLPLPPGSPGGTTSQASSPEESGEGRVDDATDEPLHRDGVWRIDIGKAGVVPPLRGPS